MSKKTKVESFPIDEDTRVLIQTTEIEAKHQGEASRDTHLARELDGCPPGNVSADQTAWRFSRSRRVRLVGPRSGP